MTQCPIRLVKDTPAEPPMVYIVLRLYESPNVLAVYKTENEAKRLLHILQDEGKSTYDVIAAVVE